MNKKASELKLLLKHPGQYKATIVMGIIQGDNLASELNTKRISAGNVDKHPGHFYVDYEKFSQKTSI